MSIFSSSYLVLLFVSNSTLKKRAAARKHTLWNFLVVRFLSILNKNGVEEDGLERAKGTIILLLDINNLFFYFSFAFIDFSTRKLERVSGDEKKEKNWQYEERINKNMLCSWFGNSYLFTSIKARGE
jgi:hypothetical protein